MSLCQIGLFKNFLCCSRFFSDLHTICNLIENMIFMNIFQWFIFQPKCFVHLPIPPTFRFVHVLPAGTRGVSHMVRHCDWSVRLDRGTADRGLLYLSRGHHTHQSPKSKKKIKFCALISICWISLGRTTKRSYLELQCLITNCINKIICNEFMSNLFLTESPLHLYQYFYDTNMYSTKQYRLK